MGISVGGLQTSLTLSVHYRGNLALSPENLLLQAQIRGLDPNKRNVGIFLQES